jgi:hypothetical protein
MAHRRFGYRHTVELLLSRNAEAEARSTVDTGKWREGPETCFETFGNVRALFATLRGWDRREYQAIAK